MELWGHGRAHRGRPALSWLLVLLAVSPASAQSSLKSRRDINVGNHPVAAIAVDFDGDGYLDIVSVDQQSDALGMIKGFGDGTFRRIAALPVGSLPTGIVFADATGDAIPDLITSNMRSQEVIVSAGDGHGGYATRISTSIVPITPNAIAAGDWNGDGLLDVAVVSATVGVMVILIGDGTGRFANQVQYTTGTYPKQVIAADFNRDGKTDLAVVNNTSDSIQIWRGDGAGGFALNTTLTTDAAPQGAAVADFNGDGILDIAVCNFGVDTVGVYLGNPAGGFGSPSILSPGFGPRATVVTDINNDGTTDLLVTLSKVSGVGQAALYLGDGSGGFALQPLVNTGPVPNTAAVGDFNQDGNQDVVTVNLTGNTVSILQNTGGAFLLGAKVPLASGAFPQGVAVADLNGDGKADVASANQAPNTVTVMYGDGLGGFPTAGPNPKTGTTPYSIVADDYNHDGLMDMVTANNGNDTVTYLQNTGTSFNTTNLATGCVGTVAVASGDVSGDLNPDLAVVCENSNQMCTRRSTGLSGPNSFGNPVCSALAGVPADIALGNINGDAFQDAAIALRQLNTVSVALADGLGGVSGLPTSYPVGPGPTGVTRGDLDGDGLLDLIAANTGADSVSVILGANPAAPAINTTVGLSPTSLAVADFNLDGRLDVAVSNTDDNNVTLLLGDGTGHFTFAGNYGTRDLPVALGVGDFNRDGKPDLAVADSFSDTLTILLNQSIPGDPMQMVSMIGGGRNVLRWGLLPGALYDVIRGRPKAIRPQTDQVDLGPVVCIADKISDTDTANYPDETSPALGDAFFYLVRPVIGGVPGDYTVSTGGKRGIPSSGDCI